MRAQAPQRKLDTSTSTESHFTRCNQSSNTHLRRQFDLEALIRMGTATYAAHHSNDAMQLAAQPSIELHSGTALTNASSPTKNQLK
jgi:hypothetical protein